MGTAVMIEADPELPCPSAFPNTDSKCFLGTMFGPLVEVLERGLGLDLGPLRYVAMPDDEEMSREDWGEEADAMIAEVRRNSELAWHPPDSFIECLEHLAKCLERSGRKLPLAVYRSVDPSSDRNWYYQSGLFCSDVSGCLGAIRWAKEHGARRVRFFAF